MLGTMSAEHPGASGNRWEPVDQPAQPAQSAPARPALAARPGRRTDP